MNKTVELVNLWGQYEAEHPDASIEDFCRHLLIRNRENMDREETLVGGVVPWHDDGLLLKIIGRISRLHSSYANIALAGTGLHQIDEFGTLITIQQQKNPRKTEVIYSSLQELSSGTDMLNRLMKRGLISEYADTEDKRSKRLVLTEDGERVMTISKQRVIQLARMMLLEVPGDDKKLCIQLLKNVEMKFSSLWPKHRGMSFDEIFNAVARDEDKPA
jgi:DNA-binding MarR family transcriptional regulator